MLFELVSVYFLLKGNLPENELDDIKGGLLLEVALDARLILPLHKGRFDEFFGKLFTSYLLDPESLKFFKASFYAHNCLNQLLRFKSS